MEKAKLLKKLPFQPKIDGKIHPKYEPTIVPTYVNIFTFIK